MILDYDYIAAEKRLQEVELTPKEMAKRLLISTLCRDSYTVWAEAYPELEQRMTEKERQKVIEQYNKIVDRLMKVLT